ncbi:MAG: hypothetical protein K9K37_00270 [Desulfocapsa sp.]|nr:hypothetical protein [Desulfocapsa sp.]
MKEKISISGLHYFQEALPFGCWAPARQKRKKTLKRLCRRYQKEINLVLAATAIGLMFLAGIWAFLVELSALCFH